MILFFLENNNIQQTTPVSIYSWKSIVPILAPASPIQPTTPAQPNSPQNGATITSTNYSQNNEKDMKCSTGEQCDIDVDFLAGDALPLPGDEDDDVFESDPAIPEQIIVSNNTKRRSQSLSALQNSKEMNSGKVSIKKIKIIFP